MDRIKTAGVRIAAYVGDATSALSLRGRLFLIGVVSVAFLWVITVAPTLVAFALTVGLAAAWCAWLEKHPETPSSDADGATSDGVEVGPPPRLAVHVLATTHEGTRSALAVAKRLTGGNDARVVLVVPRLTSFAPQFDPTGPERATLIDAHRAVAADVGVHVTVLFCVCHRLDDVAHQLLGRSALVIVGGRRRFAWPTREQRLVDHMIGEGYPVVFAEIDAWTPRASVQCVRS